MQPPTLLDSSSHFAPGNILPAGTLSSKALNGISIGYAQNATPSSIHPFNCISPMSPDAATYLWFASLSIARLLKRRWIGSPDTHWPVYDVAANAGPS